MRIVPSPDLRYRSTVLARRRTLPITRLEVCRFSIRIDMAPRVPPRPIPPRPIRPGNLSYLSSPSSRGGPAGGRSVRSKIVLVQSLASTPKGTSPARCHHADSTPPSPRPFDTGQPDPVTPADHGPNDSATPPGRIGQFFPILD